MKPAKIRNYGCRIKDEIIYKGLKTIFLENDFLRIGILVDKGTDIFEFLYKPKDIDFIWLFPRGLIDPLKYQMTKVQVGGRFLDYYEGGWQEIFPNGGTQCSVYGVEFGQHDEVALLPWSYEIVEDSKEKIELKFFLETKLTPFILEKSISIQEGFPVAKISEEITNTSAVDLKVIWGYHLVYGKPFLKEGCSIKIDAKSCKTYNVSGVIDDNIPLDKDFIWPFLPTVDNNILDLSVIPPDSECTSKFLYINELNKGEYKILNNERKLGIKVSWELKIMPYLWFWQEFNKGSFYPWYKMARVLGLEPFSTNVMGLDNTIRAGRGLDFKGFSKKSFNMEIDVLDNF